MNRFSYSTNSSSFPFISSRISYSSFITDNLSLANIKLLPSFIFILAYSDLGLTHNAKFEGSVHGVVVHTKKSESLNFSLVILNLINNAFYAVNDRKKLGEEGYEPTVSVGTKKLGDQLEISVKDNGKGIPPEIKEKIFQPFFTSKPTGEGTGLGLSLSYDIVKAHGGEIKVESKRIGPEKPDNKEVGTSFTIILPIG